MHVYAYVYVYSCIVEYAVETLFYACLLAALQQTCGVSRRLFNALQVAGHAQHCATQLISVSGGCGHLILLGRSCTQKRHYL